MANEALDVLHSIDASLKSLLAIHRATQPKEVAEDIDLDSPYGDPLIRAKDPRDWNGPSQLGNTFSLCPPEYLDLVASRLDFFAEKAELEGTLTSTGKLVAPYNRKDAARARGWAKRLRAGWKSPAAAESTPDMAAGNPFVTVPDETIAF